MYVLIYSCIHVFMYVLNIRHRENRVSKAPDSWVGCPRSTPKDYQVAPRNLQAAASAAEL
jgi:hypothetical protein